MTEINREEDIYFFRDEEGEFKKNQKVTLAELEDILDTEMSQIPGNTIEPAYEGSNQKHIKHTRDELPEVSFGNVILIEGEPHQLIIETNREEQTQVTSAYKIK